MNSHLIHYDVSYYKYSSKERETSIQIGTFIVLHEQIYIKRQRARQITTHFDTWQILTPRDAPAYSDLFTSLVRLSAARINQKLVCRFISDPTTKFKSQKFVPPTDNGEETAIATTSVQRPRDRKQEAATESAHSPVSSRRTSCSSTAPRAGRPWTGFAQKRKSIDPTPPR